jgi:hypothetical protein
MLVCKNEWMYAFEYIKLGGTAEAFISLCPDDLCFILQHGHRNKGFLSAQFR